MNGRLPKSASDEVANVMRTLVEPKSGWPFVRAMFRERYLACASPIEARAIDELIQHGFVDPDMGTTDLGRRLAEAFRVGSVAVRVRRNAFLDEDWT